VQTYRTRGGTALLPSESVYHLFSRRVTDCCALLEPKTGAAFSSGAGNVTKPREEMAYEASLNLRRSATTTPMQAVASRSTELGSGTVPVVVVVVPMITRLSIPIVAGQSMKLSSETPPTLLAPLVPIYCGATSVVTPALVEVPSLPAVESAVHGALHVAEGTTP
jgi:hypothetical protein